MSVKTIFSEPSNYLIHDPKSGSNTRNGYSSKTLLTEEDELPLQIPRDSESTSEGSVALTEKAKELTTRLTDNFQILKPASSS
ncbi:hypothetical protein KKJ11_20750 [Xenorhabdus bovienii]|nr:hypothetical protein [Xenorhabdus bovienii]